MTTMTTMTAMTTVTTVTAVGGCAAEFRAAGSHPPTHTPPPAAHLDAEAGAFAAASAKNV